MIVSTLFQIITSAIAIANTHNFVFLYLRPAAMFMLRVILKVLAFVVVCIKVDVCKLLTLLSQ